MDTPTRSCATNGARPLTGLGVQVQEPQQMGHVTFLLLDDTCGNLIQLVEKK